MSVGFARTESLIIKAHDTFHDKASQGADPPWQQPADKHNETIEKGHGRIEVRRCWITHALKDRCHSWSNGHRGWNKS